MANTLLSALTALDATSVTNNSSAFMWTEHGGNSRMIAADVLAAHLGRPLSTICYLTSAAQSLTANAFTLFAPNTAQIDGLGMWDASSPTEFVAPYPGLYQSISGWRMDGASATNSKRCRLLVYHPQSSSYGDIQPWDQRRNDTEHEGTMIGPPFLVASGDILRFSFTSFGVGRSLSTSVQRTWCAVKPIALQLPV